LTNKYKEIRIKTLKKSIKFLENLL